MTLSNTTASKQYTGDGSTVTFPTVFVFNTSADIQVIETVTATGVEEIKALTTDYTVTGGSTGTPADGDVVAVTAPPATVTWTLNRVVANTQPEDVPTAGSFDSAQIEKGLDRGVMQLQQAVALLNRALTAPVGDDLAVLAMELPSATDRASKLLGFTAAGVPSVYALTEGGSGSMSNLSEDGTPTLGGPLDTGGSAINESESAAVSSAATTDIWGTTGNTRHITGTVTITSLGTAPRAGAWRKIIFDAALTLTHGANINLPGGVNITTAAGDIAFVYADSTTQFDVVFFKKSGLAVAASAQLAAAAIQRVGNQTGAVATGTTVVPHDNTDPGMQNGEGDQYMSQAITPGNSSNRLIIEVIAVLSNSAANGFMSVGLFQDTTATALGVVTHFFGDNAAEFTIPLRYEMAAGTTSSTTFKIRAGLQNAGTTTFNGVSGARIHAGLMLSSIWITEVKV